MKIVKILIFNKEAKRRKFTVTFEASEVALEAWKLHGESDTDFIQRLVNIGLQKQGEEMSD